ACHVRTRAENAETAEHRWFSLVPEVLCVLCDLRVSAYVTGGQTGYHAGSMPDRKHQDDTKERIQAYLDRGGLARANPRVVPLTPDASDRRYFRLLIPDAPSIVLSLYSKPFDVETMPFVNVATLLAKMPVPIPEVIGHAGDLGVLALQDLGDVTLQAH